MCLLATLCCILHGHKLTDTTVIGWWLARGPQNCRCNLQVQVTWQLAANVTLAVTYKRGHNIVHMHCQAKTLGRYRATACASKRPAPLFLCNYLCNLIIIRGK